MSNTSVRVADPLGSRVALTSHALAPVIGLGAHVPRKSLVSVSTEGAEDGGAEDGWFGVSTGSAEDGWFVVFDSGGAARPIGTDKWSIRRVATNGNGCGLTAISV